MQDIAIHRRHLGAGPSLEAAIAATALREHPAILDSADCAPARGRFSILACEPLEVLVRWPGQGDPLEALRRGLDRCGAMACDADGAASHRPLPDGDVPFAGGWIGYLAYEAGHAIERIAGRPLADIRLPVARWGLYDAAAVHDALTDSWTLVAADLRRHHPGAPDPAARLDAWERCLARAAAPVVTSSPRAGRPVHNMTREEYMARVARAKEYIAAGDIFQVNIARRISIAHQEPALQTYLRLRRRNPAAYAAYMAWDGGRSAILSASPELFLDVGNGRVTTRPIKGTRPRSEDPVLDASYREALLDSQKDRAELAMIVDLERNDLGRVCAYGSVQVRRPEAQELHEFYRFLGSHRADGKTIFAAGFAELETHPTVHHLVATVSGRLRADCGTIELLRATFPGGSITGAPKVRAMEIIDELEPTQRSVYTGAIGYLGLDGRMQLNIAIRTILIADGFAHVHVGSGIVADSDPQEEYAETQAKAVALCDVLGVVAAPVPRPRVTGR